MWQKLTADRADEIPKVFTKIHVHFVITGNNLNETQVDRAVKLSAEKYCSASIMLSKSVEITYDFEIKTFNAPSLQTNIHGGYGAFIFNFIP